MKMLRSNNHELQNSIATIEFYSTFLYTAWNFLLISWDVTLTYFMIFLYLTEKFQSLVWKKRKSKSKAILITGCAGLKNVRC
jgi:hypothetical protein